MPVHDRTVSSKTSAGAMLTEVPAAPAAACRITPSATGDGRCPVTPITDRFHAGTENPKKTRGEVSECLELNFQRNSAKNFVRHRNLSRRRRKEQYSFVLGRAHARRSSSEPDGSSCNCKEQRGFTPPEPWVPDPWLDCQRLFLASRTVSRLRRYRIASSISSPGKSSLPCFEGIRPLPCRFCRS